jgi:predicted phage terminase large subunit-like protein
MDDFGQWLYEVTPKWNWTWSHLVAIREELALITSGQNKRLAIFMPPRHGKSEQTTIRYPVFRLDRNPLFRACVGCYNQRLADKFGRKSRGIARKRFAISDERSAMSEWETPTGGVYRTCGVGSPPMGEGFELLLIDDPVKSREEAESEAYRERCWDWYVDDLYTRLEPNGAIVLIQTRWHVDDLAGRILKSEDAASWRVLNLPAEAEADDRLGRKVGEALCPERYDEAALAKIKTVLRSSYNSLYQGRPVAREGNHFKGAWFNARYSFNTHRDVIHFPDGTFAIYKDCLKFIMIDPATGKGPTGDLTGIGTFAVTLKGRICILDMISDRMGTEAILPACRRLIAQWGGEFIGIEDAGFQSEIAREIRKETAFSVKLISHESKSKLVRAQRAILAAEQGNLWMPAEGKWVDGCIDELCSFTGRGDECDNQVDVVSYGVIEATQSGVGEFDEPMILGKRASRGIWA